MELKNLVWVFITVIVGIALLSALDDMVWETTNKFTVSNEVIDVSSMRATTGNCTDSVAFTVDRTADTIRSVDTIIWNNETGTTATNNLVEGTDFVVNHDNGTFYFRDTVKCKNMQGTNETNVTYSIGANYIKHSSISRTIMNTFIILFFVIGIVLSIVAFVLRDRWE